VASLENKIDELDVELNGSTALREHLERIRQIELALAMEYEFAASDIQARLEKTAPTGASNRFYESDQAVQRRAAKEVAGGYKRMAELHMAAAQLTGKTWAKFTRNYVGEVKKAAQSFDVHA
jgi:hypothetical protein